MPDRSRTARGDRRAACLHENSESALFIDAEQSANRPWHRVREVHVNTIEGLWTDVRNFLRPFKGAHKCRLSGYVAMAEFRRNHKRISPELIALLVTPHTSDR